MAQPSPGDGQTGKGVLPLAVLDLEGEADRTECPLKRIVDASTLPELPLAVSPPAQGRVADVRDDKVTLLAQMPFERREVQVLVNRLRAGPWRCSRHSRAGHAARYPRTLSFFTRPSLTSRNSVAPTVAILLFFGESPSFPTMSPAV